MLMRRRSLLGPSSRYMAMMTQPVVGKFFEAWAMIVVLIVFYDIVENHDFRCQLSAVRRRSRCKHVPFLQFLLLISRPIWSDILPFWLWFIKQYLFFLTSQGQIMDVADNCEIVADICSDRDLCGFSWRQPFLFDDSRGIPCLLSLTLIRFSN